MLTDYFVYSLAAALLFTFAVVASRRPKVVACLKCALAHPTVCRIREDVQAAPSSTASCPTRARAHIADQR